MISKRKVYILVAFLCVACLLIGSISTNALLSKNEETFVPIETNTADKIIEILTGSNLENFDYDDENIQEQNISAPSQNISAPVLNNENADLTEFQKDLFKFDLENYQITKLKTEYFKDYKEISDFFSTKNNSHILYKSLPMTDAGMAVPEIAPAPSLETPTADSKNEAGGYSTTNEQSHGFNEADIIKNDGEFLYILNENRIKIIKAYPAEDMKIVFDSSIYDTTEKNYYYETKMYLQNSKLIFIIQQNYMHLYVKPITESFRETEKIVESAMPSYYENYTLVKIFDVSDQYNVTLEKSLIFSGNCTNTRFIGDIMYLVTNNYIYNYPFFENDEEIPLFVPSYDASHDGSSEIYTDNMVYVSADSIIKPVPDDPSIFYNGITNIIAYDIKNGNDPVTKSYVSDTSNQIYMTSNSLYLFGYSYKDAKTYVSIRKFSVDGTEMELAATGMVPGYMLNQFSADEYNGYFRIATTDIEGNHLFILNENLDIISSVMGLAKGEQIKSARFIGDKGYIVTFRNMDPLFVFDLSDPFNPKITGELKIQGYSSYLHLVSDDLLIGIGEDTKVLYYLDDDGSEVENGFIQSGYKASLFDISDPYNPREISVLKLGYNGSWSDILYNHHSFMMIEQKKMFTVKGYFQPKQTDVNKIDFNNSYSSSLLISYDKAVGLNLINRFDGENSYDYYDELLNRMAYIGDIIYHFNGKYIKAYNMSEGYNEIASLPYV